MVPALDDAIEVLTYDRIIGRLDDGNEPSGYILSFLVLSDVFGNPKPPDGQTFRAANYCTFDRNPALLTDIFEVGARRYCDLLLSPSRFETSKAASSWGRS